MTMLEKAARALCGSYHEGARNLECVVDCLWPAYVGDARAVLMAIREPDGPVRDKRFTAMIDHILGEEK